MTDDRPIAERTRRWRRKEDWGHGLLVAMVVLVGHGIALSVPFQFDDILAFDGNPAWTRPDTFWRAFWDPWLSTNAGNLLHYRPLLFVTFTLDGLIGNGSAVPYRVTSLLVLVVFALLAGRFVTRLLARVLPGLAPSRGQQVGRVTALLLAAHPLLNESVLLATARSSLLMAALGLTALTRLLEERTPRRDALAVIGWTLLALLAKETAVVLAPLACLVAWCAWPEKRLAGRAARAALVVVPAIGYATVWLAAGRLSLWPAPAAPGVAASLVHHVPLADRPAEGLVALGQLARLALVPVGLSPIHELPPIGAAMKAVAPVAWLLLLACGAMLLRSRTTWRLVGVGLSWFVLALAPIVLAGLNTPAAEHRAPLALVMPLTLVALLLTTPMLKQRARTLLTVAVLGLLAGLSAWGSLPWRDSVRLWTHEATRHPESGRAWSLLAQAHRREGNLMATRDSTARALSIDPDHLIYLTQAAEVELVLGDLSKAEQLTARGLARDPDHVPLLLLEVERLARRGQARHALALARRLTILAPLSGRAWNALGNVLLMADRSDAVAAYERALELMPESSEAATNLATARARWPR